MESNVKEEIRKKLESSDVSEILERIDYLIEQEKEVEPHMIGLKIAILMGKELKNGLALGSESGTEIIKWKGYFSETEMDEIIGYARQFLMEPSHLVQKLSQRIFSEDE
jgi:hypothetical protein